MRRDLRWSIALLAGLLAAVGTYTLADWPSLGTGNFLLVTYSVALLLRAYEALGEHVEHWNDDSAGRWAGRPGIVVGIAVAYLTIALELPATETVAVLVFVVALAVGATASGIGLALAYVDDLDSPPSESSGDGSSATPSARR